ncbi:phage tail tip fiber protein, partial [Xenorhabdus bovienii]
YAINYVGAGVKYNNQFYKAGMVIGAEVKNGEVKTQIGFSANNFVVMNPANGKLESVFMIKDGQVFVRDAFIDMA